MAQSAPSSTGRTTTWRETTAAEDMEAFDALPAPIRQELASHPDDLSAESILDYWMSSEHDAMTRFARIMAELRDSARLAFRWPR